MNTNIKTILGVISLILIIILSGVLTLNYLYNTSNKLDKNIENAISAVVDQQWTTAEKQLHDFENNWEKTKYVWAMLLDHFEIDNIDNSFVKTKRYIESQDFSSALAELEALKQYILHIPVKEDFSFENIF